MIALLSDPTILKLLIEGGSTLALALVAFGLVRLVLTSLRSLHAEALGELRGIRGDLGILLDRRQRDPSSGSPDREPSGPSPLVLRRRASDVQ
jgi:hypothetical protein